MAKKTTDETKAPAKKAAASKSDAPVKKAVAKAANKATAESTEGKKAPVKKAESEPVKASPFALLPDAKLAGPPYKFDGNNHCENPKVHTILLGDKAAVHLAVCERNGIFFHNFRLVAKVGLHEPKSYGTLLPFGGTDKTLGVKTEASAKYEAARSALDEAALHPFPKDLLPAFEDAVAKLTPGILKMAAHESMLTVYDGNRAGEYMLALQTNATAHHSGLILNAEMDGVAFEAIGGALDHVGQKSKWMRGDWYIYGMANHKKQLEGLLSDEQRQTIENEAVVCRAFAHDERREHLSFSHHAEVAGVKSKAARAKWLDKAEEGAWSVKKLRTEIAAAKPPGELTNGEKKGPGGNDGGAGTGDLTGAGGGTASGDESNDGGAGTSGGGATGGKSEYADETGGAGTGGGEGGGTDTANDEPPKSQSVIDNEACDRIMEGLDVIETLLRAKTLLSPHLSASKVRGIKSQIGKLMELANATK